MGALLKGSQELPQCMVCLDSCQGLFKILFITFTTNVFPTSTFGSNSSRTRSHKDIQHSVTLISICSHNTLHDLQILGGRMPTTIIFGGSMIILLPHTGR